MISFQINTENPKRNQYLKTFFDGMWNFNSSDRENSWNVTVELHQSLTEDDPGIVFTLVTTHFAKVMSILTKMSEIDRKRFCLMIEEEFRKDPEQNELLGSYDDINWSFRVFRIESKRANSKNPREVTFIISPA